MFWRIALIVLLAAAFAAFLLWNERVGEEPPVNDGVPGTAPVVEPLHPLPPPPEPAPRRQPPEEQLYVEPEPEPDPASDPLPLLEDSDAYLLEILNERFGEEQVAQWVVRERLAERLVVFVDSLDRLPVPVEMRPIVPVPGRPFIDTENSETRWSERNFRRYRPLIDMLESIGPSEAASLYIRHYPLLQEAHSALATETAYFNDRLVEVIDHLLESEDAPRPDFIIEPHEAVYRLADEDLEKAATGKKIMWRLGPDHADEVREWLGQFRREITRH